MASPKEKNRYRSRTASENTAQSEDTAQDGQDAGTGLGTLASFTAGTLDGVPAKMTQVRPLWHPCRLHLIHYTSCGANRKSQVQRGDAGVRRL